MKTAYELAMERLRAGDPGEAKPLTAEQKKELAEIDRRYKAKIAEREVFLQKQLRNAQAAGKPEEIAQLQQELTDERKRLEEEKEAAKEKVRNR